MTTKFSRTVFCFREWRYWVVCVSVTSCCASPCQQLVALCRRALHKGPCLSQMATESTHVYFTRPLDRTAKCRAPYVLSVPAQHR